MGPEGEAALLSLFLTCSTNGRLSSPIKWVTTLDVCLSHLDAVKVTFPGALGSHCEEPPKLSCAHCRASLDPEPLK